MPSGPNTARTGNLPVRGKAGATRPGGGTWGERGNLLFKRLAFVIAAAKYQPCPVGYVRKRWFVGLAPNNGHKEGWGCNLFSTYEYRRCHQEAEISTMSLCILEQWPLFQILPGDIALLGVYSTKISASLFAG